MSINRSLNILFDNGQSIGRYAFYSLFVLCASVRPLLFRIAQSPPSDAGRDEFQATSDGHSKQKRTI